MSGYSNVYSDIYSGAGGSTPGQLPTLPTFVNGDSDITKLQSLAQAVAFLVNCGIRPTWKIFQASSQNVGPGVWTTVAFDTVAFDSARIVSLPNVIVETQGFYSVEASVDIHTGTGRFFPAFLLTAGTSNPHYTSGTTVRFGERGGTTPPNASEDAATCASCLAPVCLYPGDMLSVQVWMDVGSTIQNNNNSSYRQGRIPITFTGYWVAEGT